MRPGKIPPACFIIFVAAGLLLLFSGCIGKSAPSPQIHYYSLDYEPPPPRLETPLPGIITIEPLTAVPPYNTNRIIYSEGPYAENFYTYYMWVAPPADLVTYCLVRDLRSAGIVSAVSLAGSLTPTYRLQGSIDEFYEQDLNGTWNAVISMTLTLLKENESGPGRKICFQKNYHARVTLPQNNPEGLARAMSTGLSRISRELISDVLKQLRFGCALNNRRPEEQ